MGTLVTVGETPLRVSPPDHSQFVDASEVSLSAAGTESNVAIAASNLGTDTTWLSQLPASRLGKRVTSELQTYGVETDVNWTDDGRVGMEFVQRGAAPRKPVIIHDRVGATAASMTPGDLSMEQVQSAQGVFVSGSTAALSSIAAETVAAVLGAGGTGDGLAIFDLDFRPRLWDPDEARDELEDVFRNVDVLIANEEQLRTVFGRSGDPHEIAHGVSSKWGFDQLAMTRSEHGALVIEDSVLHEADSIDTETVHDAGQHDAFAGGYIHGLLNGDQPNEALEQAVAAATVARTIPGPIPAVDAEDVADVRSRI